MPGDTALRDPRPGQRGHAQVRGPPWQSSFVKQQGGSFPAPHRRQRIGCSTTVHPTGQHERSLPRWATMPRPQRRRSALAPDQTAEYLRDPYRRTLQSRLRTAHCDPSRSLLAAPEPTAARQPRSPDVGLAGCDGTRLPTTGLRSTRCPSRSNPTEGRRCKVFDPCVSVEHCERMAPRVIDRAR